MPSAKGMAKVGWKDSEREFPKVPAWESALR